MQQTIAQKIFTVDYESQADVKVFVVKYESQADLKVFKVKYESQAGDNDGKWFFTQYQSQAKKKIYFVKYESQADVKIFFVDYESQAGWKNNQKKHFFYWSLSIHFNKRGNIFFSSNTLRTAAIIWLYQQYVDHQVIPQQHVYRIGRNDNDFFYRNGIDYP